MNNFFFLFRTYKKRIQLQHKGYFGSKNARFIFQVKKINLKLSYKFTISLKVKIPLENTTTCEGDEFGIINERFNEVAKVKIINIDLNPF